MAMHLFSTPQQCAECGTLVSDPTVDRCPNCGNLIRERRTPGRLAGVEQRYSGTRVILSILRFTAIAAGLTGILAALLGGNDAGLTPVGRLLTALGAVLIAMVVLALAALFTVVLDVEENTRAAFGMQRRLLEHFRERDGGEPASAADDAITVPGSTATVAPIAPVG